MRELEKMNIYSRCIKKQLDDDAYGAYLYNLSYEKSTELQNKLRFLNILIFRRLTVPIIDCLIHKENATHN